MSDLVRSGESALFYSRIGGFHQRVIARHQEAFEAFTTFCDGSPSKTATLLEVDSRGYAIEAESRDHRFSPIFADMDGLYRAFGDALPLRHRIIFHGVAVKYHGKGYVFTAASGTGKSTHAFLWQRYLGRTVHILSGDKPVISAGGECGRDVVVWGSPWGGKERVFENDSAPLAGVCLISRGHACEIERVDPTSFLEVMLRQTFMPQEDPAATRALEVIDGVLKYVPLWHLKCNISEDAVRTSFEAMTGLDYDAHRGSLNM